MKKYFNLPFKKKVTGKKNKVIKIKLKEKIQLNLIFVNFLVTKTNYKPKYSMENQLE